MSDNETRLRELLACYGSDTSRWPEDAKAFLLRALERPELKVIIEEEKHFEQLMLARHIPAPSYDLSQRIIAAANARTYSPASIGWLRDVLAEVRPAALAAMLALGFAIGFGMVTVSPQARNTTVAHSPVDDEGAIL